MTNSLLYTYIIYNITAINSNKNGIDYQRGRVGHTATGLASFTAGSRSIDDKAESYVGST